MALKNKFIEKIFGGDEKAFEAKKRLLTAS